MVLGSGSACPEEAMVTQHSHELVPHWSNGSYVASDQNTVELRVGTTLIKWFLCGKETRSDVRSSPAATASFFGRESGGDRWRTPLGSTRPGSALGLVETRVSNARFILPAHINHQITMDECSMISVSKWRSFKGQGVGSRA